jgi:hypothetical protein
MLCEPTEIQVSSSTGLNSVTVLDDTPGMRHNNFCVASLLAMTVRGLNT